MTFSLRLTMQERILIEASRSCATAARPGRLKAGGSRARLVSGALSAEPPRTLPADAPTLMPSPILAEMSGCRMHHGVSNPTLTLDFGAACGSPVTPTTGWRCYEDRPGKLGWIAEGDMSAGMPTCACKVARLKPPSPCLA